MHLKKTLALLFALTLVCCSALAQTTPPPAQAPATQGQAPSPTASAVAPGSATSAVEDQPVETFHSRSDEVNVILTVTDKPNKFNKDLKEHQYKFLHNNKPPRQITNFSAETDLPLRVGLLIDASNSIRDRFLFEQDAAI
jgi:hypothetical protein